GEGEAEGRNWLRKVREAEWQEERKIFDERFIRLDTRRLCELTSAADSLDMKPLVDLTSRALARMIEGKTPEEIRETFHLPDDLTEEEKLEPVKNATDDPRIRLLNRLYARKRKELQERKMLKGTPEPENRPRDERSVDDLLSFIDGGGGGGGGGGGKSEDAKSAKAKAKKKGKKKGRQKDAADAGATSKPGLHEDDDEEDDEPALTGGRSRGAAAQARHRKSNGTDASLEDLFPEDQFEDDDAIPDDDLDPAMKEKLDREVADFARRLNSDWQDRMQELLCESKRSGTSHSPPTAQADTIRNLLGAELSSRILQLPKMSESTQELGASISDSISDVDTGGVSATPSSNHLVSAEVREDTHTGASMQTAGGDGGEEGEEEEEEQGVEEEVAGADPPGSPGPRRVASGKVRSHLNHESMADERSVAQAVTLVLNQFLCNSDLGRHITVALKPLPTEDSDNGLAADPLTASCEALKGDGVHRAGTSRSSPGGVQMSAVLPCGAGTLALSLQRDDPPEHSPYTSHDQGKQ
ncbi:hypothetical protein CYMTET_31944, partial [Cymbomonas tetramitiformis]